MISELQLNIYRGSWFINCTKLTLTYRIPLILVKDFAVTPIHVGHVNGVSICPIDFPA